MSALRPTEPLGSWGKLCFLAPRREETAYKGMVRPILKYGSSVLDPHYDGLNVELEKV